MPQISDSELANLRRLQHVENTIVNKNPAIARKFFELYKEADPDAVIPRLEEAKATEAIVDEKIKKYQEDLEDTRRRMLQREAEELDARDRARLTRPPFNLNQQEIEEVIKYQAIAHKNGQLMDLEHAARCWRDEHSIPGSRNAPRLAFSTKNNRPKNDFRQALKDAKSELFKDPRGYVAKQADEARQELIEQFGESLV